ncbi:uncharacterized protein LOC117831672 [Notolabrus celidotus]|uniref:uncharacterized protein LOC117831672 n=1 Tax=Notolabrus celidotus TaxID=1203425 RepID=UPI00148FAA62|nr:uncharacterized protein LOC117831672 [Notolabrus celidotus]
MSSARPPVEENAGLYQLSSVESPPTGAALPDHQVEPHGGEPEREQSPSSPATPPAPSADAPAAPPTDAESEPSDDYYPDFEGLDEVSKCWFWYILLMPDIPPDFTISGPSFIPELINLSPADPAFRYRLEGVIDMLDAMERHALEEQVYPMRLPDPADPLTDPASPYFCVDPSVVTPFLYCLLNMHWYCYPSSEEDSSSFSDVTEEIPPDVEHPFENIESSSSSEESEDQVFSSSAGSSSSRRRGREDSDDEADGPASKRPRWFQESDSD